MYHNNGSYNTAMGAVSLFNNTTGIKNTAVGDSSLFTNITGVNNTAIGYKADVSGSTVSNAISIGNNANAISNQLAISDSIHTIKMAGLATGRGYVLTDTAGNGNLSLRPAYNSDTTAWKTTGNSGTKSGTNFIGTTDNQNVVFKRNNKMAGVLDSALNNTSFGVTALSNNTTGSSNAAFGYNSLASNTTGIRNVAVGASVLQSNTTGTNNTGVGVSVEVTDQTGMNNTGVGAYSLYKNNGASYNTGLGSTTLFSNTTGQNNTAIGYSSLGANTSGSNNIAVGYKALLTSLKGSSNTAVGYQADVTDTLTSYAIAIGYNAVASSNQLAISDSIHRIKAKGLATGRGYILTDTAGDGNLSLRPANSSDTTSWKLSGNTVIAGKNFLGSSNNVSLRFKTNNIERMIVDSIGRVGIGVTNMTDNTYNLYVEKGIRTRKVKVDAGTWADFVFDADYKLPSLTDVENYIQQNKHLSGVPSANDVQKEGVDLGETQKVLLQKIEELTLYVIEQNKKMEAENEKLLQLEKEVNDLKAGTQK
jgi:hypothetical protein